MLTSNKKLLENKVNSTLEGLRISTQDNNMEIKHFRNCKPVFVIKTSETLHVTLNTITMHYPKATRYYRFISDNKLSIRSLRNTVVCSAVLILEFTLIHPTQSSMFII